jgi:6,7-dimethyl-8-ribityllumazine synthase
MAGSAPEVSIKEMSNAKIAIISATWHDDICADLIKGAQRACDQAKAANEIIRVPGFLNYHLQRNSLLKKVLMQQLFWALLFKVKHRTLIMYAKELHKV